MTHFPARGAWRAHVSTLAAVLSTAGTLLAAAPLLLATPAAHAQAVYATQDEAVKAFVDALSSNDHEALKHVLGNDFTRFIPTESVGEDDIYEFLGAWSQGHEIVNDPTPRDGHRTAHLAVGASGWTLPIPLVQVAHGWRFDPRSASDEILTRRIGRNERAAIQTSLAMVDAQNDYRTLTRHYAQRFVSTPGQRDGLYWVTAPGEADSPLGPLAAAMPRGTVVARDGYYGYHFKILTAQGAHAKGGPQNFVQDGVLTKGFGVVAWPAEYGNTGVMSFIVNQDGQVYEKNLGPRTASAAAELRSFDPDPSWQPVQP
jgi:hypothetical protein